MSIRRSTIVAFGIVALAACDSSTSPDSSSLEGRWATEREALSPTGSHRGYLTFDGATFAFEVRTFGLYPGQAANDLSAYVRTEGTFRVEGDRLHFSPARLVTWDRFYGADSPERIDSPYPWGTLFDNARFTMRLSQLTLRYLTYPADAPVETSQTYWRLPSALQN